MAETSFIPNIIHPTSKTVLANGLTVITQESDTRYCWMRYALRAGAKHDTVPGTAHALEHCCVEGMTGENTHPAAESILNRISYNNGGTGYHFTTFDLEGYATHYREILSALTEITFTLQENNEVLHRKLTIIEQEARQRHLDAAYDTEVKAKIFPTAPWLQYPVIGTPESINRITSDVLKEFHGRFYCPQNAVCFVIGGVKHEDAVKYLNTLKFPGNTGEPLPPHSIHEPEAVGLMEHRKRGEKSRIEVLYRIPSVNNSREHAAFMAAMNVLFGQLISPVRRKLRFEIGEAYTLNTELDNLYRTMTFSSELRREAFQAGVKSVADAVAEVVNGTISEAAHDFYRQYAINKYSSGMRIGYNPEKLKPMSSMWVHDTWPREATEQYPLLVTKDDIVNAARKYFMHPVATVHVTDEDPSRS